MRILRWVVLGAAIGAAAALLLALLFLRSSPGTAQITRLEEQGESLLQGIAAYKATHGYYPESLSNAGVSPPSTRYGPWQYHLRDNGSGFVLSVGDYGKHLFVLSWYSESGDWYLDE